MIDIMPPDRKKSCRHLDSWSREDDKGNMIVIAWCKCLKLDLTKYKKSRPEGTCASCILFSPRKEKE